MDRRRCLQRFISLAACPSLGSCIAGPSQRGTAAETQLNESQKNASNVCTTESRIRGMLLGSLIGDALGGPIEFAPSERVASILPNARSWPDGKRLNAQTRDELAKSLQLHSYVELRPETAPYGPWVAKAPAGTLTDDSRHKIVYLRALRTLRMNGGIRVRKSDFARALIAFQPHPDRDPPPELQALVDEGMREYRYAAEWILGNRDESEALPVERLWAGISNCSGQMALPPIAAIFPGSPERAYRETFAVDFIDAPLARDIVSGLNAGLAAALAPDLAESAAPQRWKALLTAIRETDPFRFSEVPFAGRPLRSWMERASSMAQSSERQPKRLYKMLENEGKPVYYWDAHFTLLVPLAILHLCEFDPLASMNLVLDFGYDSDSYAQVLGAMIGAVYGENVFPKSMATAVASTLHRDYGESIDRWHTELSAAANVWSEDNP